MTPTQPALTNTTRGDEIRREQSSREDMSPREGRTVRHRRGRARENEKERERERERGKKKKKRKKKRRRRQRRTKQEGGGMD